MSSASCTVLTGTYGDLGRRSTGYHALDGLMLVYDRERAYLPTSRSFWRCSNALKHSFMTIQPFVERLAHDTARPFIS